jgi:hypothetical protein
MVNEDVPDQAKYLQETVIALFTVPRIRGGRAGTARDGSHGWRGVQHDLVENPRRWLVGE